MNLYEHQKSGIAFLRDTRYAVLADDPGLGKTAQALLASTGKPTLVVCPKIAIGVWVAEAAKWRPQARVLRVKKRADYRTPIGDEIVVINYDILDGQTSMLSDRYILVADEGHYLKNPKTLRTRKFMLLHSNAAQCWILTGTPLSGHAEDLYGVLTASGANITFRDYAFHCWGAKKGKYGLEWPQTPANPALLERLLAPIMLRRRKAECLDLPAKTYQVIEVDSGYVTKADMADMAEFWRLAYTGGRCSNISKMSAYRATTAKAKTEAAIELAEEATHENPLVVFSVHRYPIDAVGKLDGFAAITGDTPQFEREAIVARFQAGELRGIAATIGAAGTALTLTRSSEVLFVDRDWTPANNLQAEDRCHRIGQAGTVRIRVMVAEGTLDDSVEAVIGFKQLRIDAVIERAPTPRIPGPQSWAATWSKTREGGWAASVQSGAVVVGDHVTVTNKAGKAKSATVKAIVARKGEWTLCEI